MRWIQNPVTVKVVWVQVPPLVLRGGAGPFGDDGHDWHSAKSFSTAPRDLAYLSADRYSGGMDQMTSDSLVELFRRNLKELRLRVGLSQSELARRMECAPSYICDLERGRRDPTIRTLAPLANALGTDPSNLVSCAISEKQKIPA